MKRNSACSSSLNKANACNTTQEDDFSPSAAEMPQSDQNGQEKEVLRRILQQSDTWTKEYLRACLSEDLLVWLRLQPRRVEACDCVNEEYLVQLLNISIRRGVMVMCKSVIPLMTYCGT